MILSLGIGSEQSRLGPHFHFEVMWDTHAKLKPTIDSASKATDHNSMVKDARPKLAQLASDLVC